MEHGPLAQKPGKMSGVYRLFKYDPSNALERPHYDNLQVNYLIL